MILLDTSGLLAAIDGSELDHEDCVRILETEQGPYILSPFVLAELDYLLRRRVGESARLQLLADVAVGAYSLAPFTEADVDAASSVIRAYSDLRVSLADASLVVLAVRHGLNDVLTLDERDFRVLRGAHGLPFRIFPADA